MFNTHCGVSSTTVQASLLLRNNFAWPDFGRVYTDLSSPSSSFATPGPFYMQLSDTRLNETWIHAHAHARHAVEMYSVTFLTLKLTLTTLTPR